MASEGYSFREWREIRERQSTFIEDIGTGLGPLAGVTSNALAHLKRNWITWRDDHVRIDIPSTASCNDYKMQPDESGSPPSIERRDRACYQCRAYGNTNQFENNWQGLNPESDGETSEKRSQIVILNRKITKPAVETLKLIFKIYDRYEMSVTADGIQKAVRQIGQSGDGINEYSKLLRTGPVIYWHYGLSVRDIADLTPYTRVSVKQIISHSPGVNISNIPTMEFLEYIHENEPVTAEDITGHFDYSGKEGARSRLRSLIEKNRIEFEEGGYEHGPKGYITQHPHKYWTTELWDKPFSCNKCDYSTYSRQAIGKHESRGHE
jgi:hypothetical protein